MSQKRFYAVHAPAMTRKRRWSLITLTGSETVLWERAELDELKRCVREFRRRFASSMDGGFESYEVGKGGMLHCHIVAAVRGFIPQKLISEVWSEISGRYVVDIRSASASVALRYVTKYIAKPLSSDHPFIRKADLAFMFYRAKRVHGFGEFFRTKVDPRPALLCEACGSPMIWDSLVKREITVKEIIVEVAKTKWLDPLWTRSRPPRPRVIHPLPEFVLRNGKSVLKDKLYMYGRDYIHYAKAKSNRLQKSYGVPYRIAVRIDPTLARRVRNVAGGCSEDAGFGVRTKTVE